MAKNNSFQFKQFTIRQENTAMKVGTDGILLGAWANLSNCKKILDIGCGTGLIALMLAQRSEARITALEIEANAAAEAADNIRNSPWSARIEVLHSSLQEFTQECSLKYDLVVSNPPFFSNSLRNNDNKRSLARHTDSLPFSDLIAGAVRLLSKKGKLALILPHDAARDVIKLAEDAGLYVSCSCVIRPNSTKTPNRILLEFSRSYCEINEEALNIYNESGKGYSLPFIELTKSFYLNF